MKLYQNLWAGYPAYFLETGNSGGMRTGLGFWFSSSGDLFINWKEAYYNSSFKKNPERFPLIREISEKEFAEMVLGLKNLKSVEDQID